ncbi:hypothetical protein FAD_0965 [Ferroplasma acidiphilum]|uniref:Uncharacterized protein n=1 Tax=Ferroplasma acidiphilum TaxID=74969 RepID=A0A1V0N440_9ARCH|nr:hypothetical protein FAD_0965 [Ferroplasma acidiphilum]
MKYINEFFENFKDKYIFSANDVKRFLSYRKANDDYYKIFLYNLTKDCVHNFVYL